jgi:toxin ParE1/3/4
MSRRFRLTERARNDLDEIWAYIAGHSPAAADALIDRLYEKCRQLVDFPELGRTRAELSPDLRSLVVRPYLIFYKARSDGVEIWRVLHGARDIKPEMFR